MVIERGQIFWCGLDPVQGHAQGSIRPVVVVSSDAYNGSASPLVAVVPLTKAAIKNPIHLRFAPVETGLEADSTALIDHARFIDRSRLRGVPIGMLQPIALGLLNKHLSRVFGL